MYANTLASPPLRRCLVPLLKRVRDPRILILNLEWDGKRFIVLLFLFNLTPELVYGFRLDDIVL